MHWSLIKFSKVVISGIHSNRSRADIPIEARGAEWGPKPAAWGQVGPSRVERGGVGLSGAQWGAFGHALEPK